jgi:hypothetical protein
MKVIKTVNDLRETVNVVFYDDEGNEVDSVQASYDEHASAGLKLVDSFCACIEQLGIDVEEVYEGDTAEFVEVEE